MFSLIAPAYNEEESIEILAEEIKAVMSEIDEAYEVIWVDDGSTDETAAAMARTAEAAPQFISLDLAAIWANPKHTHEHSAGPA